MSEPEAAVRGEVAKEVSGVEVWDPLRSDYESIDNRPDFRSDDVDLVQHGFSTKDQYRKVCKWYR